MAKHKYASWMAAFILGLGIIGYKPIKDTITEKPVDKKVILAIYKDNDYLSEAYNYTYAQVEVKVEKADGSESTTVLDTTFGGKLLKDYPSEKNALQQEVTIPNVFANKEEVTITYILTYYSEGSRLQMQNSMVLKNEMEQLNIGI